MTSGECNSHGHLFCFYLYVPRVTLIFSYYFVLRKAKGKRCTKVQSSIRGDLHFRGLEVHLSYIYTLCVIINYSNHIRLSFYLYFTQVAYFCMVCIVCGMSVVQSERWRIAHALGAWQCRMGIPAIRRTTQSRRELLIVGLLMWIHLSFFFVALL